MSEHRRLVISEPDVGTLSIYGSEFAIRIGADLDVDDMAEILRLQSEFRRYGRNKPDKIAEWANRARALVFQMLEREDPDVEALARVRQRSFSPSALFQILNFIATGDAESGAAAEVAAALTEGLPEQEAPEGVGPQTSKKRSRSRSSRSGRSSTSARSTGEDSDGATSASTSPTSIAAA